MVLSILSTEQFVVSGNENGKSKKYYMLFNVLDGKL